VFALAAAGALPLTPSPWALWSRLIPDTCTWARTHLDLTLKTISDPHPKDAVDSHILPGAG